jgi:nitronate monooxygenase
MILETLELPIVQAPLAGGPSTPALTAAVCEAGGFGFVAAGYLPAATLAERIAQTRALTARPFGVNVFLLTDPPAKTARVAAYAARLGVDPALGVHEDDGWADKIALLEREPPAVVSVTFGCPSPDVVGRLQTAGSEVWVTVTTAAEARAAQAAGADVLVLQGSEAGGHRGSFDDEGSEHLGLLALLQVVGGRVEVPVVASGGIATGAAVAAVLAAGARAAQLGTAFLLCPEAGTSPAQRAAVASAAPTAVTRAFTGRAARGIVNAFMREHDAHAPSAYPEVHHLTAPARAAARRSGDADAFNLWAGQAHDLAVAEPAGDLVRRLAAEAAAALDAARRRL